MKARSLTTHKLYVVVLEQKEPGMKEFDRQKDAAPVLEGAALRENRVHRILFGVLLLIMVVEWIVLLIEQLWQIGRAHV